MLLTLQLDGGYISHSRFFWRKLCMCAERERGCVSSSIWNISLHWVSLPHAHCIKRNPLSSALLTLIPSGWNKTTLTPDPTSCSPPPLKRQLEHGRPFLQMTFHFTSSGHEVLYCSPTTIDAIFSDTSTVQIEMLFQAAHLFKNTHKHKLSIAVKSTFLYYFYCS